MTDHYIKCFLLIQTHHGFHGLLEISNSFKATTTCFGQEITAERPLLREYNDYITSRSGLTSEASTQHRCSSFVFLAP